MSGDSFYEGFHSLLDAEPRIAFEPFDRGTALASELHGVDGVRRIQAFSKGFYKMQQHADGHASITDLRMGHEPTYTFDFVVADRNGTAWSPVPAPYNIGGRGDTRRGLQWVWRRMLGDPLPLPR